MKLKNFDQFLNETKTVTKKPASKKTVTATITPDVDDKKIEATKEFVELVKEAAAKNAEVAKLADALKAEMKNKAQYDEAVIRKLTEMGATSIRVGKVLAFVETKKGRLVPKYKDEFEGLYKVLFDMNRKIALLTRQKIEDAREKPDDKTTVTYRTSESHVNEGLFSDIVHKVSSWIANLKNAFFKAVDAYSNSADELVDEVESIFGPLPQTIKAD